MTILISKNNYQYHGAQMQLIRDLGQNQLEKLIRSAKKDEIVVTVSEFRHSISKKFFEITGKELQSNDKVASALLKKSKLRDGEIAIMPVNGVSTIFFRGEIIMLIAQIVREQLEKKARPSIRASVLQLTKIAS